jgi:hypothetical protein
MWNNSLTVTRQSKAEAFLVQDAKVCGGVEAATPTFFTSAFDKGDLSASGPGRLFDISYIHCTITIFTALQNTFTAL